MENTQQQKVKAKKVWIAVVSDEGNTDLVKADTRKELFGKIEGVKGVQTTYEAVEHPVQPVYTYRSSVKG